nr:hypothetical protein [Tanacetum cinerariifolium]
MFPGVVAANTIVVTGGLSMVLTLGIWGGVEKTDGGVISLSLVMPEKPYHEGFGPFAWQIPILVTISKTVLRNSKLFEGFKVQLGEDPIQARRKGIQAREEGTTLTRSCSRVPIVLGTSDNDIPAKDQPMPADASPTTRSPGYIADFKPIEDDPYKDFEMDPIDYPSDEEKESSGKEEEPLAPIDFASPVPSSAPLFEETEPFEIDDTTTTPPPHTFKTLCFLNYALMTRHDYDLTSSLRRGALQKQSSRKEEEPLAPIDFASPVPSSAPLFEETEPFEIDETTTTPPPHHTTPTSPSLIPSLLSPLLSPLPRIPSPQLLLPSSTRKDIILEADMSLQKRARFTAPSYRFDIRESVVAATARQSGSTLAWGTESYFMTALEEVMESLTDIAIRHMQDSEEFHTHHQDVQDDRVVLRACISTLARERRYYRHIVLVVDREAIIHDGLRPT